MPRKTLASLQRQLDEQLDRNARLMTQLETEFEKRSKAEDEATIARDQQRRADADNKRLRDELTHTMGQRDQLIGYIEGHRAFVNPQGEDGVLVETWLDRFLAKCSQTFYFANDSHRHDFDDGVMRRRYQ